MARSRTQSASRSGQGGAGASSSADKAAGGGAAVEAEQVGVAVPPGPAGVTPVEAPVPMLPMLPRCPRCNVGYLYVIAADEGAAHEVGQRLYAPYFQSGGSVTRRCLNCEWQDNVALNPTTAPTNPLPEG